MFNAISWQQYSTAILLFTTLWYGYTGLRYYRAELAALLKIKPVSPGLVPPVANSLTVVMGEAKPDADTGSYDPEELLFSSDSKGQSPAKGPADDLLAEAQVLADACPDKTEFLSLFKLLLDKYEVFADEISLPAVIRSLQLPFPIEAAEWPLTFAS